MGRLSIQWKISGMIFFIVGFCLFLSGILLINDFIHEKESELKDRAMLTARTVAQLPELNQSLLKTNANLGPANATVERIRIINNADYIVVLNMNRKRITHPLKEMIGTISKGSDEGPAFAEHTYTSKARGEIGTVIRAFVPVMNQEHRQIGVVITGYKLPSFFEMLFTLKKEIVLTAFLALLFGAWGAFILAKHIKRQMFHLEPHEIARLLVERTATFNAMHEGVIAIDTKEKITIFNHKAKHILGVQGDVVGKDIQDVIPDTYLPEIIKLNMPIYNKELQIRNLTILSNRVPIRIKNETVGAVAIFQDQTDVKKLAEELTGVKAFVNALRVQNHEHMNKLHTIAGLIQLGNKEKALEYVFQISEEQKELTQFLSKNIKNESLSGLLLSKVSRGKELGILVMIDRHSQLTKFPEYLDHHDFVVIIGNLIENAFDSFKEIVVTEKEVYVSIGQTDETLSILVEDNGCGIDDAKKPYIFDHGFSTKAEIGHGIGLSLVSQIVEKGKGDITVESEKGIGTSITITFYL